MNDSIVLKEGKRPIIIAFIAFILFYIIDCGLLSLLSFLALLSFVYIYRFKFVNITSLDENFIYAPISGKVISIDSDGFKKSVTIEVSLCDSHILRSLKTSKIELIKKKGVNLPLGSYKAKKLNEQVIIKYDDITMRLISSICNPSINLEKKENFKQGEKITAFLQGQVIIDFKPEDKIEISLEDKVIGGETIIAKRV